MNWLNKYSENIAKAQKGKTIGNLSLEQTNDVEKQRAWINNWNKNRIVNNKKINSNIEVPYSEDIYIDELNPNTTNTKQFKEYGQYDKVSDRILLDENYTDKNGIPTHEFNHRFQKDLKNNNLKIYHDYIDTPIQTMSKNNFQKDTYLSDPEEIHSELMRMRYNNNFQPDQTINTQDLKNLKDYNLKQFNDKELTELLNTTASNDSSEYTPMKNGGIIEDDRGQWAFPGEITKINSNNITMKGVNQKLLGISDTGDMQLMYPEQEYKLKGKNVTEFPISKNGKTINKNWLDNY